MLDDDDYWYESHINNVVTNFIKYPEIALMITKAEYRTDATNTLITLLRTPLDSIYYNNYIPRGGDSVRSASAHNIKIVYQDAIKILEKMITDVTKMHLNGGQGTLDDAADALFLNLIGKNVRENKYKSLYIPILSVNKPSDWNHANIIITD